MIIEGSFKKKMKPIPKPNPLTYTILKTRSIIIPSILIKKKNHNPIPSTLFSLKHFDSQELNDYFFPNNKKKKKESSIDTSTIEESINRPFTLFHPPPSPPTYLQEKWNQSFSFSRTHPSQSVTQSRWKRGLTSLACWLIKTAHRCSVLGR